MNLPTGKRIVSAVIHVLLCASLLSPTLLAGQSVLQRHYVEGQPLVYRMTGSNEAWHYSVRAEGRVKRDATGTFFEEYEWTRMESNGQPAPLRADSAQFRQRLTLDPDQRPSVPDLTKVDPRLIGPITDLMTFYTDLWLAGKTGQLKKPGDHFYFPNPTPGASWADGVRVVLGESAVDFDMTLKSVDTAAGTAVLEVRHVPPGQLKVKLPADWMKTPVGEKPNNWVGITKEQNGTYTAAVGEETFMVALTLSTTDGKILRASMDNAVKTFERSCKDEALNDCTVAKPHVISRKIAIELLQ